MSIEFDISILSEFIKGQFIYKRLICSVVSLNQPLIQGVPRPAKTVSFSTETFFNTSSNEILINFIKQSYIYADVVYMSIYMYFNLSFFC